MATKTKDKPTRLTREFPPATSAEEREDQLTMLAMDRIEMQIRDGTASSQILAHFLSRSSRRGKLEEEKLAEEVKLAAAKTDSIKEASNMSKLFEDAIAAMRIYSGANEDSERELKDEDV